MEHCNQCILQINLAYQKNENPGVVAKSKCLIGEYNKIKGMHNAEVRCYSIPLRGNQVNPSYCKNWQFIANQGITCSKSITETSKQLVVLPMVNNRDTKTVWIAILVYLY